MTWRPAVGRTSAAFFSTPHPPPLGRAITRAGATPRRLNPPAELAAFVNEPFYPPLSTRMFTKALTQKQRSELERYRAAKVALQNELRAELDRLRATDPAARAEELATLSRRQTRKIAELEKAAV